MDFNALMQQAQNMQSNMDKQQKEIENKTYQASVGGGMVKVELSGKGTINSIDINEALLDKENKEDLEMLIMLAVNNCLKNLEDDKNNMMQSVTGGLNLGGLF